MRNLLSLGIVLLITVNLSGCGGATRPPMGYVSGTVTLDGQPLPGVIIVMKPDNGRMATAITNPKGYYDIEYIKGELGTKIGPNTISFEWPLGATATKPIPASYSQGQSTTKLDVKSGRQTFDIDIKSESPSAKETAKPVAAEPELPVVD